MNNIPLGTQAHNINAYISTKVSILNARNPSRFPLEKG